MTDSTHEESPGALETPGAVDPMDEIAAMQAVATALQNLDKASAGRVLRWAVERFGTEPASQNPAPRVPHGGAVAGPAPERPEGELFDLLDRANPASDAESALVAAYWLQFIRGEDRIDTQSVNSELKQLGRGIGNITRAFEALERQKPALVLMTRKTGKLQQSRKQYKVTEAGRRRVEKMINGSGE